MSEKLTYAKARRKVESLTNKYNKLRDETEALGERLLDELDPRADPEGAEKLKDAVAELRGAARTPIISYSPVIGDPLEYAIGLMEEYMELDPLDDDERMEEIISTLGVDDIHRGDIASLRELQQANEHGVSKSGAVEYVREIEFQHREMFIKLGIVPQWQ